jgi:hypothetical protein
MFQFRSVVDGLIDEAREELLSKLMMVGMNANGEADGKQVPPIDWARIRYQPSKAQVGWSVLDDERNKFAVDGQWWLYKRMHKKRPLREQFIDGPRQLKKNAVVAYERHVEQFQELLLMSMYINGG